MNTMMAHVSGQDYRQRTEAIKRKNTEDAFARHMKYNGENQKTLSKLEELITGKKDLVEVGVRSKDVMKLNAGQVKQIAVPVGKTLAETIDLWRDVRREAVSIPEPTTTDHQLAAKASAKIRQAEAQIGLLQAASMELPSTEDREAHELQKRYEQAISSYSFHVQMKENGFEIARPTFFKIA